MACAQPMALSHRFLGSAKSCDKNRLFPQVNLTFLTDNIAIRGW